MLRHVNKRWKKTYLLDKEFRKSYRLLQALAFVPVNDVTWVFELLQKEVPDNFMPIVSYFEKNYIGKLKPNSKSCRDVARFPIDSWNLYERVISKKERTNNDIESWHSARKSDVKKNLTLNRLIQLLKEE